MTFDQAAAALRPLDRPEALVARVTKNFVTGASRDQPDPEWPNEDDFEEEPLQVRSSTEEAEGKLNQKSQAACQMFDLCANERSPVQEESSDFSVTGSKVKPSIVHLKRNANKWRPGGGTIAAPSNQRSQVWNRVAR